MVRICDEPRRWLSCRNREEVNWDSLSVVIVEGTPNIDIQESISFIGTVSHEVSLNGTATGHLVNRSIQVKI